MHHDHVNHVNKEARGIQFGNRAPGKAILVSYQIKVATYTSGKWFECFSEST